MALVRSILFVDGENLTMRYQALVASGRTPKQSVKHVPDVYVWTSELGSKNIIDTDLIRINYYTSMVGDDDAVAKIRGEVSALRYSGNGDYYGVCHCTQESTRSLRNLQNLAWLTSTSQLMS